MWARQHAGVWGRKPPPCRDLHLRLLSERASVPLMVGGVGFDALPLSVMLAPSCEYEGRAFGCELLIAVFGVGALELGWDVGTCVRSNGLTTFSTLISAQARGPAEFKHIIKRRKRN